MRRRGMKYFVVVAFEKRPNFVISTQSILAGKWCSFCRWKRAQLISKQRQWQRINEWNGMQREREREWKKKNQQKCFGSVVDAST